MDNENLNWEWTNIRSRRGRFKIPEHFIRSDTKGLALLMASVIVTRCEHIYDEAAFFYHGYSPLFDKVDQSFGGKEYVAAYDDATGQVEFIPRDDLVSVQQSDDGS